MESCGLWPAFSSHFKPLTNKCPLSNTEDFFQYGVVIGRKVSHNPYNLVALVLLKEPLSRQG